MYSKTFSRKSCLLWDNLEMYCRAGQATDDSLILLMLIACSVTNVTETLSKYVILLICSNMWRRRSVAFIHTWPVLFFLGRFKPENHSIYLNISRDNIHLHIGPSSPARILERLLTGRSGNGGLIPSRTKEFFFSLQHPNGSGTPPTSYTVIAEGNILVIKLWGVNLTSYRHLVPLWLLGDIPPSVFKFSWCFVK